MSRIILARSTLLHGVHHDDDHPYEVPAEIDQATADMLVGNNLAHVVAGEGAPSADTPSIAAHASASIDPIVSKAGSATAPPATK